MTRPPFTHTVVSNTVVTPKQQAKQKQAFSPSRLVRGVRKLGGRICCLARSWMGPSPYTVRQDGLPTSVRNKRPSTKPWSTSRVHQLHSISFQKQWQLLVRRTCCRPRAPRRSSFCSTIFIRRRKSKVTATFNPDARLNSFAAHHHFISRQSYHPNATALSSHRVRVSQSSILVATRSVTVVAAVATSGTAITT